MSIKLTRWDAAEYLETTDDMAEYLDAVLIDTTPELTRMALQAIARAIGIREISKQTGIDLNELKRAFLTDLEPDSKTVQKLLRALNSHAPAVSRRPKTVSTRNVKRTKRKAS